MAVVAVALLAGHRPASTVTTVVILAPRIRSGSAVAGLVAICVLRSALPVPGPLRWSPSLAAWPAGQRLATVAVPRIGPAPAGADVRLPPRIGRHRPAFRPASPWRGPLRIPVPRPLARLIVRPVPWRAVVVPRRTVSAARLVVVGAPAPGRRISPSVRRRVPVGAVSRRMLGRVPAPVVRLVFRCPARTRTVSTSVAIGRARTAGLAESVGVASPWRASSGAVASLVRTWAAPRRVTAGRGAAGTTPGRCGAAAWSAGAPLPASVLPWGSIRPPVVVGRPVARRRTVAVGRAVAGRRAVAVRRAVTLRLPVVLGPTVVLRPTVEIGLGVAAWRAVAGRWRRAVWRVPVWRVAVWRKPVIPLAVATARAVGTTGAWAPFLGESAVAPTAYAGLEPPVPAEAAVRARTARAVTAVPGETVVGAAAGARAVAIGPAITATLAAVRRTAAAVRLTVAAALVVVGVSVGASAGPAGTARRARIASRAVTFLTRAAARSGSTGPRSEEPAATPARPARPARHLRLARGAVARPATVTSRRSRAPDAVMLAVTVGSALTAGPRRPVGRAQVRTAARAVVRLAGVAIPRPAVRSQSVAVPGIRAGLRLVVATTARQGCAGSTGPLRPVRRARARRVRRSAASADVWPARTAVVLRIRAVAGGLPVRRPVVAPVTARRVASGRAAAGGPVADWPTVRGPVGSITAGRLVTWMTAGSALAISGRRPWPVGALPGRPELAAGRRSARVPDRAAFLAGSGTALAAPRLSSRWLI